MQEDSKKGVVKQGVGSIGIIGGRRMWDGNNVSIKFMYEIFKKINV